MKRRNWPHHSHAEMAAAHYICVGPGVCRYRMCRREIFWYQSPRGKLFPVDPKTFEPHFATCVDRVTWRREQKAKVRSNKNKAIDFEIGRRRAADRAERERQCTFSF